MFLYFYNYAFCSLTEGQDIDNRFSYIGRICSMHRKWLKNSRFLLNISGKQTDICDYRVPSLLKVSNKILFFNTIQNPVYKKVLIKHFKIKVFFQFIKVIKALMNISLFLQFY